MHEQRSRTCGVCRE